PRLAGITDAGYNCALSRGQITGAQFFRVRQFVEIPQTEMLQKKLRRLVKQWTPWQFRAPADFYQTTLHQILQDTFDSNAANRFDIGPGYRLAISDNGECLQRRW